MIELSLLIAAAGVAMPGAAPSTPQAPTRAPVAVARCAEQPCGARARASCVIDRSRSVARTCQHSARDMEELGRWQLDQLIASLN